MFDISKSHKWENMVYVNQTKPNKKPNSKKKTQNQIGIENKNGIELENVNGIDNRWGKEPMKLVSIGTHTFVEMGFFWWNNKTGKTNKDRHKAFKMVYSLRHNSFLFPNCHPFRKLTANSENQKTCLCWFVCICVCVHPIIIWKVI